MVIMHGLFDLKSGYSSSKFKLAFDDFCAHLKQEGLLASWSYMQRTPDDVYDAKPPVMQIYVAMKFSDEIQAQASKKLRNCQSRANKISAFCRKL